MTRWTSALCGLLCLAYGLSTGAANAAYDTNDLWLESVFTKAPKAKPSARKKAKRAAPPIRAKNTRRKANKKSARAAKPRNVTSGSGAQVGIASFYWQPQRVASGGWFNPNAMTAAHRSLPFGTRVKVTNLSNKRSVVVKINDRGPFIRGRIIDLSRAAAGVVGMRSAGLARVKLTVLGR